MTGLVEGDKTGFSPVADRWMVGRAPTSRIRPLMTAPNHRHPKPPPTDDPADKTPSLRVRSGAPLATSEHLIGGAGHDHGAAGHEADAGPAPSPPLADRKAELRRVTRRLMAIMATHVDSARRMGLPLNAVELQQVLAALQDEAAGRDPRPALDSGGELAAYVKQSLYDELLGEPSNVFMATRVNADTMRYEPMQRDFWQECLDGLQQQLGTIDVGSGPPS